MLITVFDNYVHVNTDSEDQKYTLVHTAAAFGIVLERDRKSFDLIVSEIWNADDVKEIIERAV